MLVFMYLCVLIMHIKAEHNERHGDELARRWLLWVHSFPATPLPGNTLKDISNCYCLILFEEESKVHLY